MTTRNIAGAALAALLATAGFAGEPDVKPSCCRKATQAAQAERLRCGLTGKIVDKCCCVQREGKTHCTLADKDVATCCCTRVQSEATPRAKQKRADPSS